MTPHDPSLADPQADSLARDQAFSLPLDQIDVSKPRLFQDDTVGHYFERLRRDDVVHWQENSFCGGFWSVTRYEHIMQVDTQHGLFSSDWTQGGIALVDSAVPEIIRRQTPLAYIKVLAPPQRVLSNYVRGFSAMTQRLPGWALARRSIARLVTVRQRRWQPAVHP